MITEAKFVLPITMAAMLFAASALAFETGGLADAIRSAERPMPSTEAILTQLSAPAQMELTAQDRVSLEEFVERPDLRHAAPSIDLDAIRFDRGSPTVRLDELLKVQQVAQALNTLTKGETDALLLIEAFADEGATDEYSQVLSEERAQALKSAMVRNFGTPEDALRTVGFGRVDPAEAALEKQRYLTLRRIDHFVQP